MLKKCIWCGKVFEINHGNQKRCPECVEQGESARPKKKKVANSTIPITKYSEIIEKYNKKHNTNYSYGQFELLQFLGKITLGGEKE